MYFIWSNLLNKEKAFTNINLAAVVAIGVLAAAAVVFSWIYSQR